MKQNFSATLVPVRSMTAVIKGFVIIKVRHGLLKNKQLPGTWGVLYDAGGGDNRPPRIELYDEKNSPASALHTLYLEQVKFLDKSFRHQETSFTMLIKKEKHFFEFESIDMKDEWVQALCHVSPDLWKQRASTLECSDQDNPEDAEDMNVNLLYDSYDKVQYFKVSIVQTKTSEVNNLQGHYMLSPTKESLRLLDVISFKCIHEWPYRQIRKYGRTKNIFRMEVGRRCTTGEGEFEFFTPEGSVLTDLITVYTKQVRDHDKTPEANAGKLGSFQSSSSLSANGGEQNVSPSTSNPHCSPGPPIPRRVSENCRDSKGSLEEESAAPVSHSQRGSSMTQIKTEPPRPAPRNLNPKLENGIGRSPTKKPTSDNKIYETSSGLTAPLDQHFRNELHSKLQIQMSNPGDLNGSEQRLSSETIDEDLPSSDAADAADAGARDRTSSEGGLPWMKKKSDKEKKKKEKEEVKQRKQQEKEEKEQREREAKEQKALEKKQKQKVKGHSKLFGKKSSDLPYPTPQQGHTMDGGNIYDEPGELLAAQAKAAPPSDGSYAEVSDIIVKNLVTHYPETPVPGTKPSNPPVEYAVPEKPKKDSWKERARPETEDVQQENYDSIRQAALSQPSSPDVLASHPGFFRSLQLADQLEDDDGTYDRLGNFDRRKAGEHAAEENLYGMASSVPTIASYRPAPPVPPAGLGNKYEEANVGNTALSQSRPSQETGQYEESSSQLHQRVTVPFTMSDDGEYADVC